MTWNAIEPAKACDIADFWAAAPWPLTRPQTNQRAAELGWTIEDGDFLVDEVSGLSMTDVDTSVMPDGRAGVGAAQPAASIVGSSSAC